MRCLEDWLGLGIHPLLQAASLRASVIPEIHFQKLGDLIKT